MGASGGAGSFGFLLTAIDGQATGGGGADRFRIKIWDKTTGDAVVYDNQLGDAEDADPTTTLAGGSIVITANPVRSSDLSGELTGEQTHEELVVHPLFLPHVRR